MSATLPQSAPNSSSTITAPSSRGRLAGRILSGLAIAFLTFDVVIKLLGVKEAVQGTVELGYQPHHLPIIGTIGLVCLILLVIPRTAPLGAVLWTGYLGGAIATNLRLDKPLLTHTLFPIYVAALIWGGLYLRHARVRGLVHSAR
jgi:hypothetical protein